MPQNYFVILTDIGRAKLANALSLGRQISLTHMVVGDGNGSAVTPDASRTSLVHEVYRAQLNALRQDEENPAYLVAELVIPPDTGGWTLREAGFLDADGDLFGIGNLPETYKPQLAEGSAAELRIRLTLEVGERAPVQLKIDPTVVLASRKFVELEVGTLREVMTNHIQDKSDPHDTLPDGGSRGDLLIQGRDGLEWQEAGARHLSTTVKATPGEYHYVKPAHLKFIEVEVLGGGGAGGGAKGGSFASCGSGGGAGGWAKAVIMASRLGADETYTVGAGGVGQAAVRASNPGGTSSFGSFVSATGGRGGFGMDTNFEGSDMHPDGGRGGHGVGGDVNATGSAGGGTAVMGALHNASGIGAPSFYAGGGLSLSNGNSTKDGEPGTLGGGGGGANVDNSVIDGTGGNGGDGLVIIREFV
ncbi:phage tail protein [Desulfobaculum bizertense]|uniref:Phage tail-collar fibre protein n=1 Tax=Desulfobaculum bizertense DSM 18034 TaxID=1121442 RepID=A0A1T4WZ85_9BACT|nr:phage tail protein [Desulfobaculum bizertense]SKA81901.1 Phage tail-collar fibre protein [Desulfobaculum bizertense DSM 18034]